MNLTLSKSGFGLLDAVLFTTLLSGVVFVGAAAIGQNTKSRTDVYLAQKLRSLESAFHVGIALPLHEYFSELQSTHHCNQSNATFKDAFGTVRLTDDSTLSLVNPSTVPPNSACAHQTWAQGSDFSGIDSFSFCMRSEKLQLTVEFKFEERSLSTDARLRCNEINSSPLEVRKLRLRYTAVHDNLNSIVQGEVLTAVRLPGSLPPQVAGFGLYEDATRTFYLDTQTSGNLDTNFQIEGLPTDSFLALTGNWNGNQERKSGVALYSPVRRRFYLRNSFTTGPAEESIRYPQADASWLPIAGNWGGTGQYGLGLFDPATQTFYLDTLRSGDWDVTLRIRDPRLSLEFLKPFSGDWTGSGTHSVGIHSSSGACLVKSLQDTSCESMAFVLCGTHCTVSAGNRKPDQLQDSLIAYLPHNGTFGWLHGYGRTLSWDGTQRLGPIQSVWQGISGYWNGRL